MSQRKALPELDRSYNCSDEIISDKWGKRGPLVLLGVSIGCVLMVSIVFGIVSSFTSLTYWSQIANRSIVNTNELHGKFALITLIKAFGMAWRK